MQKNPFQSSSLLSLRHRRRKDGVPTSQPRLTLNSLNFNDPEQLSVLKDMGIVVQTMAGGRVQISHAMQKVLCM